MDLLLIDISKSVLLKQVLWVLHKSGMEDLLLFIASSSDEAQYCLHVLEIISLMFREQVTTKSLDGLSGIA